MKPNNQPDGIEITSSLARSPNDAARATEYKSAGSGAFASVVLIFGAWVAGTLLFEISALENVRSNSASEHWGNHASLLESWTERQTEVAAVKSTAKALDHIANPLDSQHRDKFAPNTQGSDLVMNAASVSNSSLGSSAVKLSSHQTEVRQNGLQLPQFDLPSISESDEVSLARERK